MSPVRCVHTEVGGSQVGGGYPRGQRVPRDPLGPLKKARFHSHLQPTVLLQTCGDEPDSSQLRVKKHGLEPDSTLPTSQDVLRSLDASQRRRAVHEVYHRVALE